MKTSHLAYYIIKVTIPKSFFLNIAPENFTQPTVITINGRSLLISWEEPLVPNGIIRNYTITRTTSNNIPVTIATVNSRIFNYTDQGLNPFTNYNYTIIATNAGGSIETDTTSGTTGQALATGLTAPLTVPVNSTVIFVSWDPPSELNGILESYRLYRIRLSDPSDNGTLINQGLVTNFEDNELVPYTNYQYYYDVVNGAGSVESPLSIMTRTLPGIPSQGPGSIATTINSTAILLSWNAPPSSTLQGPLVSYEIQWSASNIVQQEQIENITADTNMYIISDLLPNTQYTFRVSYVVSYDMVLQLVMNLCRYLYSMEWHELVDQRLLRLHLMEFLPMCYHQA